jgi:hypothetical protein
VRNVRLQSGQAYCRLDEFSALAWEGEVVGTELGADDCVDGGTSDGSVLRLELLSSVEGEVIVPGVDIVRVSGGTSRSS